MLITGFSAAMFFNLFYVLPYLITAIPLCIWRKISIFHALFLIDNNIIESSIFIVQFV